MFSQPFLHDTFDLEEYFQFQYVGISGVLMTIDDCFMQLIEGPKEAVQDLYYKTIFHDDRHVRLKIITEGAIEKRDFAKWEMGIKILDGKDGNEEEILDLKHRINEEEDLTLQILQYFYETGEVELDGFWKSLNK